jgi:hypothetical protein
MRMKASDVGEWLRQRAGKRDHREVVSDDYLVLRPGPNFEWLMGLLDNPATAQPRPLAPERSSASDDGANDGNSTRRRPKGRLRRRASGKFAA